MWRDHTVTTGGFIRCTAMFSLVWNFLGGMDLPKFRKVERAQMSVTLLEVSTRSYKKAISYVGRSGGPIEF